VTLNKTNVSALLTKCIKQAIRFFFLLVLASVSSPTYSQILPDELNLEFTPPVLSDVLNQIEDIVLYDDDPLKVIVVGAFDHINGVPVSNIARLNADGSVDVSFNTQVTLQNGGEIQDALVLDNGKILIAGLFTHINDIEVPGIARLNSDGSLDSSFTLPAFEPFFESSPISVRKIEQQSNGQLLLLGSFGRLNGASVYQLIRVSADGALDGSFPANRTDGGFISRVAEQSDGKIMVAGSFTRFVDFDPVFRRIDRTNLARLHADGSVDESYDVPVNSSPTSVKIDSDDTAYIVGNFTSVASTTRNRIAKIDVDGVLDVDFDPNINSRPSELEILPNGNLLVGGGFTMIGSQTARSIAELSSSGDIANVSEAGFLRVDAILPLPSGDLIIGGPLFAEFLSTSPLRLMDNTFELVNTFNPGGFDKEGGRIEKIYTQGDNIYIVGYFSRVDGEPHWELAKLNENGTLDESFKQFFPTILINDVAVLPDDKVIVSGDFSIDGEILTFAKLNADGSPDATFIANSQRSYTTFLVRVLADGSILATNQNGIQRYDENGVLDVTYNVTTSGGFVKDLLVLPNDKLLIVGDFSDVNGQPRNNIARLLEDGSLDPTFEDPIIEGSVVDAVVQQRDGQFVMVGTFETVGGETHTNIARIDSNGSVDNSFTPSALNGVRTLAILPDQSIVIGGSFTRVNGTTSNRKSIARLNPDGSLAENFAIPIKGQSDASTAALYSIQEFGEGRLLVGGEFFGYGDTPIRNLILLGELAPEVACFVIVTSNQKVANICL